MQLKRKKLWLSISALGVLGLVLLGIGRFNASVEPSPNIAIDFPGREFPLPPISPSPFLNTQAHVNYVGSNACIDCHASETESFRQTGMGISTAIVDPAKEPPDAVFTHNKSRHRYQVLRKDGLMWHREIDLAQANKITEYPVRYVIGSGINARTYAIEDKGFMAESPITWYAKPDAWNMSPGYDAVRNQGFEREISVGCLYCHAGRANNIENKMQRIHIQEAAIGCERCHGPGELHVAKHSSTSETSPIDHTIVNPPHLDRDRAEAICQQCHLHIEASVLIRNRSMTDYRPGQRLNDFRQDYQLEAAGHNMNVVGHVEQMHLSRCYTQTETFTCTTCHNPHQFPKPQERLEYYRNVCMQCHQSEQCKVDPGTRASASPENDCVSCHMPTAKTEIQHVAFTHHRVGIHKDGVPTQTPTAANLSAWNLNTELAPIDQELNLGLAYAQLAKLKPEGAVFYNAKAIRTLMKMHESGMRGPVLDSVLARIALDNGRSEARPLADIALSFKDIRPDDRCVSLFVAAVTRLGDNQPHEALPLLQELTQSRRYAIDWVMLAEAQEQLGHKEEAKKALAEAHRISPSAK